MYFNSRPREGANRGGKKGFSGTIRFQFPPPRGGEQCRHPRLSPLWYFNSRPREGANVSTSTFCISPCYFNSRPREGANPETRGPRLPHRFQFPPPRGGERLARNANNYFGIFQFPPPRGGEPCGGIDEAISCYFNSRPREGANARDTQPASTIHISIPAPARGRT